MNASPWKPRSTVRKRRAYSGEEYNAKSAANIERNLSTFHAITRARALFPNVEISDRARVKPALGGAYVEAWVWVAEEKQ